MRLIFIIFILIISYIININFKFDVNKIMILDINKFSIKNKIYTNSIRNSIDLLSITSNKIYERGQSSSYEEKEDDNSSGVIVKYNNIEIRNHTNNDLDIEQLCNENVKVDLNYNSPKVFIYHTHTTEAYKNIEPYSYAMTEEFRTLDNGNNVVKVGDELVKNLKKYNINAEQSTVIHDYPEYTGSYDRSFETVAFAKSENMKIPIIIDLHRDAIGENTNEYRLVTNIEGKDVAKLMFVIGTDGNGLKHSNWKENLKLAIKIQAIGNEIFPNLFREIDVRKERFNQHVGNGAFILEVGGTGNTIDESMRSMECFAEIINKLCNDWTSEP